MSDDRLIDALARAARDIDRAREDFEASPPDDELSRPLTQLEQREIANRVLPPRRKRFSPLYLVAAGGIAAALGIALTLGNGAPLPKYEIEVESDSYSGFRSPASGPLRVVDGMTLRLLLRPEVAAEPELAARSFIVVANERKELAVRPTIDRSGAVRFSFVVGRDLSMSSDAAVLELGVGRPEDVARWQGGESNEIRVLLQRVEMGGEDDER